MNMRMKHSKPFFLAFLLAVSFIITPNAIALTNQAITGFAPASPIIYTIGGTGTFMLSATGGASGNPVIFNTTTPSVCAVSGTNGVTTTVLTPGTCILAANQAGNASFNAAPQVIKNVLVNKIPQVITAFAPATPIVFALGGTGTFALSAMGGASGNPVTFSSTTPLVCAASGTNGVTITVLAPGTCMLSANQAGDSSYASAVQVSKSVVINKIAQVITGFSPPTPIVYTLGGSGTLTLIATGGASTSPVLFASSTATICTTTGANGSIVTILLSGTCTLTANQAGDANYSAAAQVTKSIVVNKIGQTITSFASTPPSPIAYANGITFTVSATGGASPNPVVFSSAAASVCTVNANVVSILTAGTCALRANQLGDTNYSAASQQNLNVVISKLNQTITGFNTAPVTPVIYDSGLTLTLAATAGAATTPLIFTSATATICTVAGNTATILTAGTCTLRVNQASDINYNAAPQLSTSIVITKANQTITGFAPLTPIAYSSNGTFTLAATPGASSMPIIYTSTTPSICTVSTSTVTVLALGTCTLKADQAANISYNAAPQVTASVLVTKGIQTILGFAPTSPIIYASGTTFNLSATGGASGNPVIFASTAPAVCTTSGTNGVTVTVLAAGNCNLTADQLGSSNYNAAAQATASVTINKIGQNITSFTSAPASPITYSASAIFTLAAAGGASGNPVFFTSTTPSVCNTSGSNGITVAVLSAGICTVTADQLGNSNYSAAPQQSTNLIINKLNQSITGVASTPVSPIIYSANATLNMVATSSNTLNSGNPITFTSITPSVCITTGVNGATASILAAGTCTIAADQLGNVNYNTATQTTTNIVITKANQTITSFNPSSPQTLAINATFSVTATTSVGAGSNPVVIASATPSICSASSTSMAANVATATITVLSTGTCILTADQSGNANYNPALQVTASIALTATPAVAQMYFIYVDHLNTPRAITTSNTAATKVWEWKNDDPFGANVANENPANIGVFSYNLRFAGQYWDRETGLSYNGFRDYDSSLGRYVKSDPVGLLGGMSTFAYAGGNAISQFDFFGLASFYIGIEIPNSKAISKGVLNPSIDPGHTFAYLVGDDGKISNMLSVGPANSIGALNKNDFLAGSLGGVSNWPLSGEASTYGWDISSDQFKKCAAVLDKKIKNPGNYSPSNQCTSAALDAARECGIDVPDGVSPLNVPAIRFIFKGYSESLPNPYGLATQLNTVKTPVVVHTSKIK